MIDLYTWGTPNGRKVSVMLEECGLPYQAFSVNISKDEQFAPDFLKISPNNKIPAIVDTDGPDGKPISVFETGAILIYLAQKTGKFLPSDPRKFADTMQWLMWQMGGLGPMLGQTHHFRRFAPEQIPYAVDRYTTETKRLYGVLDKQVGEHGWLAAGEYTIADIASFPWIARYEWQNQKLEDYPNLKQWYDRIWAREAVKKGFEVP
ncbi:MAG: glutathione binding-like protein [Minwuia sp.]|nr:glutathione binding-like protein [Minwuia sp.]